MTLIDQTALAGVWLKSKHPGLEIKHNPEGSCGLVPKNLDAIHASSSWLKRQAEEAAVGVDEPLVEHILRRQLQASPRRELHLHRRQVAPVDRLAWNPEAELVYLVLQQVPSPSNKNLLM